MFVGRQRHASRRAQVVATMLIISPPPNRCLPWLCFTMQPRARAQPARTHLSMDTLWSHTLRQLLAASDTKAYFSSRSSLHTSCLLFKWLYSGGLLLRLIHHLSLTSIVAMGSGHRAITTTTPIESFPSIAFCRQCITMPPLLCPQLRASMHCHHICYLTPAPRLSPLHL